MLNDKQEIAEHEHEVWQKSSNIFTSFALKVRRQKKEATILVPSSSAAPAIGIKNFVSRKPGGEVGLAHRDRNHEDTARRYQR
jgi:hypothetical protein